MISYHQQTTANLYVTYSQDTQSSGDSSGSGNAGSSGNTGTPTSGGSSSSGDTNNTTSTTNFPAGSFAVETFLDTITANCTSDAATWQCNPYSTYAESPSNSAATFNWTIEPVDGSSNYTITSTPNVFANFTNLNLDLKFAGTENEAYFFQFAMNKVVSLASLGSSNEPATCTYNSATFQAYLYTKMAKTYPAAGASAGGSTTVDQLWPYAAKVEQVIGAASGTPTCVDATGNSVGDFSVSDGTQLCDCLYLNTGT